MRTTGLYVPGSSPLHRTPAGVKLLLLLATVTVVVAVGDPIVALLVALAGAALYPLCGMGLGRAWRLMVPLLPFLGAIVVFQMITGDRQAAARLCAQLGAAVLLAGLVTLSTRVSEMLALFERLAHPLRFVGARPEGVALVLALTVRSIPLVAEAWRGSREAYAARGLRGRPQLLVVPVIVGLIRSAEAMGEAMTARGIDG